MLVSRRQFLRDASMWTAVVAGGVLLPGVAVGLYSHNRAVESRAALSVGYLPVTHHLVGCVVGHSRDMELSVRMVKFGSWPEVAEALKAGHLDMTYLIAPLALRLRAGGVPIKMVAAGHRNGSIVTAPVGSAIHDVPDLQGKKVAVPARFSSHNLLLRYALRQRGLKPDSFEPISMGPPEMVPALAAGEIDAYFGPEPFSALAEIHRIGYPAVYSRDLYPDHMDCTLCVSERLLEAHPERVQSFVTHMVAMGRWAEQNREAAADAAAALLNQKPEVLRYALTRRPDHISFDRLMPDPRFLQMLHDEMMQLKMMPRAVPVEELVDSSFMVKAELADRG